MIHPYNSSMNDQSTTNKKCDFCLFDIFNDLTVIENGRISMYHRKLCRKL